MEWNSYDVFFNWLSEMKNKSNNVRGGREEFWKFGLENIMFAAPNLAEEQFFKSPSDKLKRFDSIYNVLCDSNGHSKSIIRNRDEKNGEWSYQTQKGIYVREQDGSKKQGKIYIDLYKKLFPTVDYKRYIFTDNKQIRESIRSFVNEEDVNFQCSHVFERSLNPIAYMAIWNFALTPKMFDPLTGHETKGVDNVVFQIIFQGVTCRLQKRCIDKYNAFISQKKDLISLFVKNVDDEVLKRNIFKNFKQIKEVEFAHKNQTLSKNEFELKKRYSESIAKKILDASAESIEEAYKIVCEEIMGISPEFRVLGRNFELPANVEQKQWLEKHGDIVMIEFVDK